MEWLVLHKDALLIFINLLVFGATLSLNFFRNWHYDVHHRHYAEFDLASALLQREFQSDIEEMLRQSRAIDQPEDLAKSEAYILLVKKASKCKDRSARLKFFYRWLHICLRSAGFLAWTVVLLILVSAVTLAFFGGSLVQSATFVILAVSILLLLLVTTASYLLDGQFMASVQKTKMNSNG